MEENWKDIQEFKGKYQISNLGRIKSISRKVSNGSGFRNIEEKILTFKKGRNGYIHAILNNINQKARYAHRLVAIAFIPNPKNKPYVNHINGIKDDNRVENLEWCTQSENLKHAYSNGFREPIRGNLNSNSKLSEEDAVNIKYNHTNLSHDHVAELYGISSTVAGNIRTGKKWKHI